MPERVLDKIHIRGLRLRCIVGVFSEERQQKQEIVINITLFADLSRPGRTDDITDTIDYKAVKLSVIQTVESSRWQLVEALAESIAQCCLEHPLVEQATVSVDKPGALRFAESVAVEITRRRGQDD